MASLAPPTARKTKPAQDPKRSTPAKPKPHPEPERTGALHPPPLRVGTARAPLLPTQGIQAKLTVSEPDDELEREADRVADHVMRKPSTMAAPSPGGNAKDDDAEIQRARMDERKGDEDEDELQRACADCDEEEGHVMRQDDFFAKPPPPPEEDEEEKAPAALQTKASSARSRRRRPSLSPNFQGRLGDARRGSGEAMPAPLRGFMAARFGDTFDHVRIHRDATAADLTSAVHARAFTIGRHVFFNRGEFQPQTQRGQRLVAHELTHVLQQRGGLHSVQREVMDEHSSTDARRTDSEREGATERLSFATLAELFDWRDDVLPPLVFQALRDLMTRALNVVGFRESLATFILDRANDEEDIRRIVRSPNHELTLELERRGRAATPETHWELEFLDRSRIPASGGGPVTIHTDEDSISVGDPRPQPKPPAEVTVPTAPPPTGSTTSTSAGEPTAAGAAATERPEAAKPEAAAPAGETPAAEGASPLEEAAFPASPQEDPSFQAVVAAAEGAANTTSAHSESDELAGNAKDAAAVAAGEQLSKAQGNKTDQMQSAKTPGFDKAAFVKAVLDKVRATAPKSLPEASSFARDHKAGIENTVNQAAGTQTDRTAGELKTVTDAAPNTGAVPARPAVALDTEAVGAPPADIRAERAVPPERPESQVEGAIAANQAEAKKQLDDLGYTNAEETFAKSNDPEMMATLESKKAFDEDAAAAPTTFRQGEQALRTNAMADAGALGKEKVGAMFGARADAIGKVATGQAGGKTKSEARRAEVISEVNRIFTSTETKVKNRLSALKQTVFDTFKTESQIALDTFTQRVVSAEARWEEKGFFGQAADKIGSAILGIPNELEADLQATRNAFIEEMTRIVERIAATVETELQAAKDDIAAGRAELTAFLDGLEPGLETLKGQLSAEFAGKFGALETSVKDAEKGLVTGLAEQFKARLDESEKLLTEVRARNRDFFDVLADGITAIRDKTIGLIEKLQQVFQDGVETLMKILDDPIAFAKNLLSGIAQGFDNFVAHIGTHLKAGLIEWLTGSVAGAGITLPTTFDVKGIVGFILQLLGLTIDNVKARARVIWGEKIVRAIEMGVEGVKQAIELFNILQSEGVAGLFRFLKEKFTEFKDIALEKIRDAITLELVEAAVKKVATLLIPGGAFLQAVLSIIDAVFFFIRNAEKISALVQTVINAVKDILAGNISALAAKVEAVLASTIPIVLDFLATLIGIGSKITETIQKALKAVTQPIQDAIDSVLIAIKNAIGGFIDRLLGKGAESPEAAAISGVPDGEIGITTGFDLGEEHHALFVRETAGSSELMTASAPERIANFLLRPIVVENSTQEQRAEIRSLATAAQVAADRARLKVKREPDNVQGIKAADDEVERAEAALAQQLGKLIPSGEGPDGSVSYSTDGLGRPSTMSAHLTPFFIARNPGSVPGFDPPGWPGGSFFGVRFGRAHLLAQSLGGDGGRPGNLATAEQDSVNTGLFGANERAIRAAVRAGQGIQYTVRPSYQTIEVDGKRVADPIPVAFSASAQVTEADIRLGPFTKKNLAIKTPAAEDKLRGVPRPSFRNSFGHEDQIRVIIAKRFHDL